MRAILTLAIALAASPSAFAATDTLPGARRPGFSAVLAEREVTDLIARTADISLEETFFAVAAGSQGDRQALRWDHALNLLAHRRAAEARAVLDVMLRDDPDLALVGQFQLARGAALTMMGRGEDALTALAEPSLLGNASACLFRIRASMQAELPEEALRNVACAGETLTQLPIHVRRPYLLDLAKAELASGEPERAGGLLVPLDEDDATANLLRGKAHAATGDVQEARLLFGRVVLAGSPAERADAALSDIELTLQVGAALSHEQQSALNSILLSWRGGAIERRALRVEMALAGSDDRRALSAGATLFRYHRLGPETRDLAEQLARRLSARLEGDNDTALEDLGALFWEYRDLMPGGAEGDRLVTALARRFQEAGLYARGAQLLDYRLRARARDIAKGPLSVEVATLYILAGLPREAMQALKGSADVRYPDLMRWDRQKVEAVALYHLHRPDEALAVLQDVPGTEAETLAADMLWRRENWRDFVETNDALISTDRTGRVEKVAVLRHAIALAMLGETEALGGLRRRFGSAFVSDPLQPAFDLLTSTRAPRNPDAFAAAMAALPTTVEAGSYAKLLAARVGPGQREAL